MPKLSRLLFMILTFLPCIIGRLTYEESRVEIQQTANNNNNSVISNADPCGCQNGGTCILHRAFCHCPSGFQGRFCQRVAVTQTCNDVSDGQVILDYRDSCQICLCRSGIFRCETIYNCDSLSLFTRSGGKFLIRNLKSQDAQRSSSRKNVFNPLLPFNILLIARTLLLCWY